MKIVQVTDTHDDLAGCQHMASAISRVGNYDMLIVTGDIVPGYAAQGFSNLNSVTPTYALAIGNHDVWTSETQAGEPSSWDFTKRISQNSAYETYFKNNPKMDSTITIEPNSTWWYKDLPDCRILGLDYTVLGEQIANETQWLNNMLAECEQENIPILIASHHIGYNYVINETSDFTDPHRKNRLKEDAELFKNVYTFQKSGYDLIVDHCDNHGLRVIAWITGHMHYDMLLTSNNTNKFPIFILASTYHDEWTDLFRNQSGLWQNDAVVQSYEWDSINDTLLVTRYGTHVANTGCLREFMVYDCAANKIISGSARGI